MYKYKYNSSSPSNTDNKKSRITFKSFTAFNLTNSGGFSS